MGLSCGRRADVAELGLIFFIPHPPPPDTPHLDSYGRKKKKKKPSFSYLIFGKPPGDHNLVLRTPPSLPLLGTDTHTHTHSHSHSRRHTHPRLYTMVVQAAVAPNRSQRLLLKIPYGSLRRRSVERVSNVAGCLLFTGAIAPKKRRGFFSLYIASLLEVMFS